ncbi:cytochrome P450 [Allobranchiibius sp. GilTou38]|uniref:cytochrome P450 n=1 Tax=Allobranchiibius sp. GilTou38 TaxID=2815210 RepID=UPI001AA16654|nr:cytochrome P450 [Allobranchiibius sp. GilTou38]MBO1768221.1 cytochrome P450 [Allobranchiibius sp. GilTou38]
MADATQLKQTVRFATSLYADKGARAYHAFVRREPLSQLAYGHRLRDPYPNYEVVRARGPFVSNRFGHPTTVDHAVCNEILRSRRFGPRAEHEASGPGGEEGDLSFLTYNPPDHTRLRRLVAPAFGPRQMRGYRGLIEQTVDDLLHDVEEQGSFDLVSGFASPLPIAVISRMMGIPDSETDGFATYGAAIGTALSGVTSLRHAARLMQASRALTDVFTRLFELRRREPHDDVISHLVAAQGEAITPEEMVPLCTLLLLAGFETTVNAIGNGVLAFMEHRDQWERLVADPGLAAGAVEEVLRFDAPVQGTSRVSFDDTVIRGTPIGREELVQLRIGGANRDPTVFDQPDRFDITRPNAAEHLTFSGGIHYCLGAPLARLELEVVFGALARRLPQLRRTDRPVRYRRSLVIHGPAVLPMRVR